MAWLCWGEAPTCPVSCHGFGMAICRMAPRSAPRADAKAGSTGAAFPGCMHHLPILISASFIPDFFTGACDGRTKHTSTSWFSWIQQCMRHFEASCLSKGTQVKGWSSELLAPWVEKALKENLQFIFKSVSFRETPKHTSSNEWII